MRIDGDSSGSPLYGRRHVRSNSASGARRTPSMTPATTNAATGTRHASELLSQLHGIPDVRPEVIEEVRRRLQRGELLTREAAEATAAAILSDLQSFLSP